MAIPVWSVGQVLTASDVNTWFVPVARQKSADEPVTSNTTLQNDDHLVIPVSANANYKFDGYLAVTGAVLGNGDIKIGFTAPSGATFRFTTVGYHIGGTPPQTGNSDARGSGTASVGINGGAASPVQLRGFITTSSTAGSFTLQWAQNTSSGTATTVLTGSELSAQRIG